MLKKLLIFIFTSSLLFASSELSPNNFAYGAQIEIKDKEAIVGRVGLNEDVYLKTFSKNLDDIRIFDKNTNMVPFSLVPKSSSKIILKSLDMAIFPIGDNEEKITRELEQKKIDTSKYEYTYIITLPENSNFSSALKFIKLEFDDANYNYEAEVGVAFKENTNAKEIVLTTNYSKVMQLKDEKNQNSLKLDMVELNFYGLQKQKKFYQDGANSEFSWTVKLSSDKKLPKLINVVGYYEEYSVENDYITFNMKSNNTQANTFDFSLPNFQPISEIHIYLDIRNAILPVEIFYKSEQNDEWVKLQDMIVTSIGDNYHSNKISFMQPLYIRELKIKSINTHFNNNIHVSVNRKEYEILFNSANNAPFLLAYGSNLAKKASIDSSIFLEQKHMTYTYFNKEMVLAGEKAYIQKTEDSQNSSVPKWLIWTILGFGVIFLVFLAYKLSKEIKKEI